jgi:hypothetical protein
MYFEIVTVGGRRYTVPCSPDTPTPEILRRAAEQADRQEVQERRELANQFGHQR